MVDSVFKLVERVIAEWIPGFSIPVSFLISAKRQNYPCKQQFVNNQAIRTLFLQFNLIRLYKTLDGYKWCYIYIYYRVSLSTNPLLKTEPPNPTKLGLLDLVFYG